MVKLYSTLEFDDEDSDGGADNIEGFSMSRRKNILSIDDSLLSST